MKVENLQISTLLPVILAESDNRYSLSHSGSLLLMFEYQVSKPAVQDMEKRRGQRVVDMGTVWRQESITNPK